MRWSRSGTAAGGCGTRPSTSTSPGAGRRSASKGRGKPTVKHRKTALPSLEYTTRGFTVRDGRLILPKGVSIPVVWSRDLPSAPKSVRVYQDNLGHWCASFVVTREIAPAEPATGSIGVDWGIRAPATTTDPAFDLPYLGHRKQCAAQVARAQRKVVLVQPAYTTMTCSECGERQARLGLAERTFRCASCGYTADRDRNAARVILAVAERGHASADDVSHWQPPPGGSLVRSELEIPRL